MSDTALPVRSQETQPEDGQRGYPGLHKPVQHLPETRFKHAIADLVNSQPITTREIRMLAFVNQLTDKPRWHEKVFDDAILTKWKQEASNLEFAQDDDDVFLSEAMFKYCIAELQDKAERFRSTGFVSVLDTDQHCTVTKSDSAIAADLLRALKDLVKPLEDVPDDQKDWHPGSDGKVLDLVHPSLYPLILGKTRALLDGSVPRDDCVLFSGSGEVTSAPPSSEEAIFHRPPVFASDIGFNHAWGSYQWLPSMVNFDDNNKAHITSYINNLHPKHHSELYTALEHILDATIPLWNEVLTEYDDRIRIKVESTSDEDYVLIQGRKYPHKVTPNGITVVHKENSDDETDEDLEWDSDYRSFKRENSILIRPEPAKPYRPHEDLLKAENTRPVNLIEQFKERGLQVIFKLANIVLTPESSNYDGGSWHIEGALNEHIVATAIVYYDQENITDSHLSFRHSIDAEELIMMPQQNEYDSACQFFGVQNDESNEQDVGSILTKEGRLLCFPNTLQHRVGKFSLADTTKPGHRKILAMFLVDPNIPILSTANVPPQRQDWWIEETLKIPQFAQLPVEVFQGVVDAADGILTWKEALDVREKLMAERTVINDESIRSLVETFSFCEH